MLLLTEVVRCVPARGEHLTEVLCLVPSAGWFPRERRKEVRKEQVGVRDKRMNCQRPPGQVWFLQRPCCKNCCQQGCVTPELLGEGAHSALGECPNPKPLAFVGQFEKTYYTGRYKLLIFGSIPK